MEDKASGGRSSVFLRRREVLRLVGFSYNTLRRLIKKGLFPRPVKLSAGILAWRADEVAQWIETRCRGGR